MNISPTLMVLIATSGAILALVVWTLYSYFIAEGEIVSPTIIEEQYYSEELQIISAELDEFKKYQIVVIDDDVDLGKPDPFGDF